MSAQPPYAVMAAAMPPEPVDIAGVRLVPIEYAGRRVLTLAMMDAAHQRPDGTAGRNFRENRARLVESEDYVEVTADEIRRQSLGHVFPSRTPKGILLTETGYSMLVKSFTDDLAWDVQRQLVKSYFAKPIVSKPATPSPRPASNTSLAEARAIDFIGNMIARVPGARAEVVATVKLRMIEERTGIPATQFGTALPAGELAEAVKLNPTEIGARLGGLSAIRVNKVLIALGLQRKSESGHVLTEAGAAHGESRPFQAKNHHVGDQINWFESVVEVVRAAIHAPVGGQLPLLGKDDG